MSLKIYLVQVRELTLASLKARYRKTWAGFIWVVLNPILMFGAQSLVFRKFLQIEMADYYLFLLGGLLPWIFLTGTIQMGTPLFVSQSQLLRSFKINPWVMLGSQVIDNFINFMASFFIIMMPFFMTSEKDFLNLLLLPLAFFPLLIGTLCITITLSVLNVFYRDINFVVGFIFSLLFFLTPIFYPRHFVPVEYHILIDYNPAIYLIEPFRSLVFRNDLTDFFSHFGKSVLTTSILAALAFFTWKRKQNDFYRKL